MIIEGVACKTGQRFKSRIQQAMGTGTKSLSDASPLLPDVCQSGPGSLLRLWWITSHRIVVIRSCSGRNRTGKAYVRLIITARNKTKRSEGISLVVMCMACQLTRNTLGTVKGGGRKQIYSLLRTGAGLRFS